MARTLKLGLTVDGRQMQRDLKAIKDGLDRPITDVLRDGAAEIADMARGFLHAGQPSWPSSSAARDYPGGMRAYYDSSVAVMSATVGTTHPGAPVWEYGGEIHPRSGSMKHAAIRAFRKGDPRRAQLAAGHQVIVIPADEPVRRAGDSAQDDLAQRLADAVNQLVEEYGF